MQIDSAARKLQILVVDDNTPDVVLIGESLQALGLEHTITHCSDGEKALCALSENRKEAFDAIILDLNMPKLSGMELLEKLQGAEGPRAPILVLTSSMAPGEQAQALALGADRFLRKPSDLDEFLTAVGAAVREMLAHRTTDSAN